MKQPPDAEADVQSGDSVSVSQEKSGREMTSDELLKGEREILIRHGEDLYRLRLTRKGKLILQK